MTTKTPLILAAEAARDARAARVDIDAKLAELREQSADIAALQEALAAAREKRTAALADALVHSRKADTGKVDKEIAAAQLALQRREDEVTAVQRATEMLSRRRDEIDATIAEAVAAYHDARTGHALHAARQSLCAAREAVTQLRAHIGDARAQAQSMQLSQSMPLEARQWWNGQQLSLRAEIDMLVGSLPAAIGAQALSGDADNRLVTELEAADMLAGIIDTTRYSTSLGYVWKDGTVHDAAEPASEAVKVIDAGVSQLRGAA